VFIASCRPWNIFKPPAGEVYTRIENSRGELAVYVRSNGDKKPLRVKMRGDCRGVAARRRAGHRFACGPRVEA
jgi:NADH:ubiquinone oxidoreductase subunit D